mgnify:CR=1 FL=1
MPRPTRRRKPYIVVFCEGESEQAYTDFLKKEFRDVASIKRPSSTGLFEEADNKFKKDKAYRDYAEVTDEVWFFFDVETKDIGLWDARMKIIKRLRSLRKKSGIKVRLLMTTGCIEYWLLLHYEERYAPPIQTVAEKQRVIDHLLSKEPNYQKGDVAVTAKIAKNYPTAVINAKQTVFNLLPQGLPGLEDTDERNTFGTPQKLMAYDLLTGKTRTVLDGVSDIAQMCRIGNTLYFTCYTYTDTDKTQWGFCLYAYDIHKDWPACIYATPNTSDGVALAPCGYTLFYLCNTRNQDGMSADEIGKGELHACTAAEDKVLQSGLETDRAYFYDWSDSAAYLLTNNGGTDSYYHLDYKGKMTPTNHRPKTEPREENAEPSTKPVIVADYQNYSIEITCTVPKKPGDSDCGYRYIAQYVLKEKATGKSYALCSGSYWYYYI